MMSAWYGGLGAGLLATILSALSLDYFFISRNYSLVLNWSAFLRLGVFVIGRILDQLAHCGSEASRGGVA